MNKHLISRILNYLRAHKLHRRWLKAVGALACVVVFCTVYALVLPAVTLEATEKTLTCPLSVHEHTADCYDGTGALVCGKADFVVHTHTEDCYDADGELVCTLPEIAAHVHTDACYATESVLICGQEEAEAHTHTESCYESVLTCGQEASEGHTHTGECYAPVPICGQEESESHTHTEECYGADSALICTLPEAPAHTHTEACYETVLNCGLEATEGHAHTAECYTTEQVLTCTNQAVLHTHTDSCYDAGGVLLCGQLEVQEHTHGEGCFTETEAVALMSLLDDLDPAEIQYSGACGAEGDNVVWNLTYDGILIISGEGEMKNYTSYSSVPWYNNYSSIQSIVVEPGVTSVGNYAFYNCYNVRTVKLPEGLTKIGNYAFYYCYNYLTDIELPDSLTSIGNNAFYYCRYLTSIEIPENVTSIGNEAFRECRNLTTVKLPDTLTSIGSYVFYYCDNLIDINIPADLTSVSSYAFYNCYKLTGINIPSGVTSIGSYAFYSCYGLTGIELPANLTSIGSYAFYNCNKLTSIKLPSKLTSIGSYAFSCCTALSGIEIPASVTSLYGSSFHNCSSLTGFTVADENQSYTVADGVLYNKGLTKLIAYPGGKAGEYTLPSTVTTIGNCAFTGKPGLTEITIPAAVSTEQYAFRDCSTLQHVTFADGTTTVGSYVLYNCDGLTEVTLPAGLTSIGDYAFYDCDGLADITLPDSLTNIGTYVFYDCDGLTSITLPAGLTSIGTYVFYDCDGLTSITLPAGLTSIGTYAFYDCDGLTSITLPDGLTSIGDRAFYSCGGLTEVTLPSSLRSFGSYVFAYCSKLKNLTLPEGMTILGSYAFYNCTALTGVTIPSTLTSFGSNAFNNCTALTDVTLCDGLTQIGSYAFYNCTALRQVTFPNTLKTIGSSAFYNCTALKQITLPESLTTINPSAFYNCTALTKVTFPTSLTYLGSSAFYNCEKLADVWMNAAGCATVASSVFTGYSGLTTAVIGNTVDTLQAAFLTAVQSAEIRFEGPNDFQLVGTYSDGKRTLTAGQYHVDQDGLLYLLHDGEEENTAELVYGLDVAACAIPETITTVAGRAYTVTKIAEYAFAGFEKLTSVTFADNVEVADWAFYHCVNLSEVNGKNTIAALVESGISNAEKAFYLTALWSGNIAVNETSDPIQLGSEDKLLVNLETKPFAALTGQHVTSILTLTRNKEDTETELKYVRIYFSFDADGGCITYPVGPVVFETETDSVTGIVVQPRENLYYIELGVKPGQILSLNLESWYENRTAGGSVLIWTEIVAEGSSAFAAPLEAHKVIWETRRNDLSVYFSSYGWNNYPSITWYDGAVTSNETYWYIYLSRNGGSATEGSDYITSVDFTATMDIPDDFCWREGLLDAVENGDWRVNTNSTYSKYFYVTIGEVEYMLAQVYYGYDYARIRNLDLSILKEEQIDEETGETTTKRVLQFKWRLCNTSASEDIATNSTSFYLYKNMIIGDADQISQRIADSGNSYTYYNFTLHANAMPHYTYSEDPEEPCTAKGTISGRVNSGTYSVDKSSSGSQYLGGDAQFYIYLSNKSTALPCIVEPVRFEDSLPTQYYITPANMQKMFERTVTEGRGNRLTIQIANASLYDLTTTNVNNVNGETYAVTRQYIDPDTPHEGMAVVETASDRPAVSGVTITITMNEDGTYRMSVLQGETTTAYSIGEGQMYATLQAALNDIGYMVTSGAQYTATLVMTEDLILYGSQNYYFYIYATAKDAFTMLAQDRENGYPLQSDPYVWYSLKNDGYVYPWSTNPVSSWSYVYRDFTLYQYAYRDGKQMQSTDAAEVGDVISYQIQVKHTGSASYDALPLVEHIHSGQALLAAMSENPDLEGNGFGTQEGIETDTDYYILDQPGTYENVRFGSFLADQVVVEKNDDGGLDTLIYWYLDINGSSSATTVTVPYQTLVTGAPSGEDSATGKLRNEVWLNDRAAHRLYAAYDLPVTLLRISKNIVTNLGDADKPDDDQLSKHSNVAEGATVTYRLRLETLGDDSVTVHGNQIYDALPLAPANTWTDASIAGVRYVTADPDAVISRPNETEPEYFVSEKTPEDKTSGNQRYLRWNEDFSLTFQGTMDIYVDLVFPSDTLWASYSRAYASNTFSSTLYVLGMADSVTHLLSVQGEGVLQKGVYMSGVWNSSTNRYYSSSGNQSRSYYVNDSVDRGVVGYYITLYNSGDCRMYLSEIQDVLPKGFTFYGLYSDSSYLYNYSSYTNRYCYTSISVTDPGEAVAYRRANVKATTKTNVDGQQVVSFTLNNSYSSSSSYNDLSYDSELGKFYLKPREAVTFIYFCRTNSYSITRDYADSVATMPYYNYNGYTGANGVAVDNNVSIYRSSTNQNDGTREIWQTAEVTHAGFSSGVLKGATDWLTSGVTVMRGGIQPGLTEQTPYEVANVADSLSWTITASNSGQQAMRGYTLTDVMMAPYQFMGTVSYNVTSPSGASATDTLFTVNSERAPNDSEVTIRYRYSSSSYKNVTLTVGGGPVTISHYTFGSVEIGLSRSSDGSEVLTLYFPAGSKTTNITSGGTATLTVRTQPDPLHYKNYAYINTSYLTPDQSFEAASVTKGTYTTYNGNPSVTNEAWVSVTFGYITVAGKRVTDLNDSTRTATSNSSENFTILSPEADKLRYTLQVSNDDGKSADATSSKAMHLLVIIDNLPESGDHATFFEDEDGDGESEKMWVPRYSDFKVVFADDPEFEVKVGSKALTEHYTLQYTQKTEFTDEDWAGTSTDGWYTKESLPDGLTLADMRSFRIVITDPEGNDAGKEGHGTPLIPPNSTVTVSFTARISDETLETLPEDAAQKQIDDVPLPSETAWNSFGYHYMIVNQPAPFEAAPRKVGVKLPSAPQLDVNLLCPDENAPNAYVDYPADEDERFHFLIYSGSAMTFADGATEADIYAALQGAGRSCTYVTLQVDENNSLSDAMSLYNLNCYRCDDGEWIEGDAPWIWEDGKSYTLLELGPENPQRYGLKTINDLGGNSCTFTYHAAETTILHAAYTRKIWSLTLYKTDAEYTDMMLSGAVFGLYTRNPDDAITDADYNLLTAGLKELPQKELVLSAEDDAETGGTGSGEETGETWYLMDIQTTPDGTEENTSRGVITWNNLIGDKFYVLELQAPEKYNLDETPGQVVKTTATGYGTQKVFFTNACAYTLPEAGGMGTAAFTTVGSMLMLASAAFALHRRRRHAGQGSAEE